MSRGLFHHDNRSRAQFAPLQSPPLRPNPDSDSDSDLDITGHDESHEAFEMTDLTPRPDGSLPSKHGYENISEDDESDDDNDKEAASNKIDRRGSTSTTQSYMLYTPDEERCVIKKFDRKLVLFVAFLYMLSFLDRSNIGNAKIAGMSNDLHLSSPQFEWLLRAFYITYLGFEWMALMWKLVPPHVYLSICVASWGVVASLQSLSFSFWSMFVLRISLGIGEAAFVGIPFYLSFFYKRDELALRTGLFISAAPLATSFAGSLAWLIIKFGDHIPIASWRLLFLLEGFPSIVVAVFVFLKIPDSPESAKYLTPRERRVARLRLRKEDNSSDKKGQKGGLKWKEMRDTLLDPKSYLTAAMLLCCNVAFSSLPVFLPTIIEEMGYSALRSQALSAPPFLVSFFTVLLTAFLSDRYRNRSTFIIFHAFLAASGYTLMAIAGALEASAHWRYAGVYPASMGFFSAVTIIITWTINNQDSDSKKGTNVAMLNYIGQLGPLIGVHLYPDSDEPYYVKGMAVCAGFLVVAALLAFGLRWLLAAENRRMALEEKLEDGEDEGLVGQERRRGKGFVFML